MTKTKKPANPPKQGRPIIHVTAKEKLAAAAEAARRYRDRKRKIRDARQAAARTAAELDTLKANTTIDLSAVGFSRKKS